MKEIKIELTDKCYRGCIHCSSDANIKEEQNFLSVSLVKRLIEESSEMGIKSIVFTGGEIELYPREDLFELISFAKEKDFKIKLYTMCYRNDNTINFLVEARKLGLDEVIYSTTEELCTSLDDKYTIEEFFTKLNYYTDLKIGFHHVLTSLTIEVIDRVFSIIKNLDLNKFNKVSFLRYVPHGRGDLSLVPSKNQINDFKTKIKEYIIEYPNIVRLGSPNNILGITNVFCNAAEDTFIVGFDGNVYPCDAMKYFDYLGSGGNIYRNSLEEIYNSKYFSDIRTYKEFKNEKCKKCLNYNICQGGCLGQKMIYNINESDEYTCLWYELNTKRTMNDFGSKEKTLLNAKTGIIGETGELIDCVKKLYTHNLTEEKKETIKRIISDEIGDIIWYIAAPFSNYFEFSFEEVVSQLIKINTNSNKIINENLIKYCSKCIDPECPVFRKNNEISLSNIDNFITNEDYNFEKDWEDLVDISYFLMKSATKEEAISRSALLLKELSKISNNVLGKRLEDILKENIQRLKERYKIGYSEDMANERISVEERYKTEELGKARIRKNI